MEDPRSMSTEELRAAIQERERRVEAEEARFQQLQAETEQAKERLRLRNRLDGVQGRLEDAELRNKREMAFRQRLDHLERSGPPGSGFLPRRKEPPVMQASSGNITNCAGMVASGNYVWRITGFSWLKCMLMQQQEDFIVSDTFKIGSEEFDFFYSPWADRLVQQHNGSLAISLFSRECIALRYRIYIKARNGEFVQWGETCDVVHHSNRNPLGVYGPDVHWPGHRPASLGIFGLSHEELLASEWVENDTLTLKYELEVRPEGDETTQPLSLAEEVPEPTILEDTRALLEEGTCSDVKLMVQDEVIQAHSQVLCARSEVFRKQLTTGMQETFSKVIVIEDCDVGTFKAFLQFLYTDRFPEVKDFGPAQTSSNDEEESDSLKLSRVQALLAISNKYQVRRLQLWCEAMLCKEMNTAQVCGILCQAHLLQAKKLEKACLSFIKDHSGQVFTLPAYADLIKKWPQIGLKVHLFSAGVSEAEALAATDALEKPQEQQSEQSTE